MIESLKAKPIPAADFLKTKRPVLLTAQPTHFTLLQDPEDLRKWESALKEQVGLSHITTPLAETCTESGCPSNDCDTD
jgi:hypothetical protein